MAKQRKSKAEEPKPENSGTVVRHQKLCLSIDIPNRQIYGYTELEIVVPDIGIVGLHAENLGIDSVFVDGEPAEFEYYPHHQQQHQQVAESESRWRDTVVCPSTAADAVGVAYVSALEKELVPNLLINCCKAFRVSSDPIPLPQVELDDGIQSSDDSKQNVRSVRVNYWVERADSGIHFDGSVLHTNNQIRRARCWFPCIDGDSQRWCYDLEFTVAQSLVAVSSGNLLYQVLTKDDPPRKTFVYRLDTPAIPRWISLVVAPFEIFPDPRVGIVSHMCLAANFSKLKNTVGFFHNAFKLYEEYLGLNFPFGSYTQVFVATETTVTSTSLGASMSLFSSQLLYDDNIIDQAIDTSISLALALARQWFGVFITPEEPNDEWLVDGLAAFLTDLFIKKFLGNNEVRYRRFKANSAVCKADDSGATVLSSSISCKDLYGTHCIGEYGKIRAWKSVAVLQMLEKQMGPESFRKILQRVVSRAREAVPVRSLSTKEFRHFSTKVGNLERPFVKEFFPRWVCSCGCPIFRMGLSYNKRKNMVELAVLRECTVLPDSSSSILNTDSEFRDGDQGWPGMMSIRVHELDGMYDHPVLPLAGDAWQLLEIPCHSKLAAKRFMKPKKGSKPDGSDDNDLALSTDVRSNLESPLLWLRADPEMEYLADIHFNQPVQMWINQLEKDGDVVAQAQAISALEALPQLSFAVINSLTNFLGDSKAFWRVRIEAAFALAKTASEDTDWAGLLNLVKFYKSRRFDSTIGLPRPNDFNDFSEYFVLEAIPHAVSMVRTADGKSPREAVEFILQLLKHNDNTGNRYSDVFWLAANVEAAGQLEFDQHSDLFLSPLLKRIDRLLQYDRLMPSYNGILTCSCIRTLTQITTKLSCHVHLVMDNVFQLIKHFRDSSAILQVKVAALRALLDLEFHSRGLDALLRLFMTFLKEEPSLRGQIKLCSHVMRLCQTHRGSDPPPAVECQTFVALLVLLESSVAFNNVVCRHYLFCIIQIIAGRAPTLFGVPRDKTFHLNSVEIGGVPKNIFTSLSAEFMALDSSLFVPEAQLDNLAADSKDLAMVSAPAVMKDANFISIPLSADLRAEKNEPSAVDAPESDPTAADDKIDSITAIDLAEVPLILPEAPMPEDAKPEEQRRLVTEAEPLSKICESKMPVLKIKVKQSAASSRIEDTDDPVAERSHCGNHDAGSRKASSSVSVDAPQRNSTDAVSASNQHEEVNSCIGGGRNSHATASIGSAKLASDGDNGRELQCTADSVKGFSQSSPAVEVSGFKEANDAPEKGSKRRRDPEYLERKRRKKEKKQKKKEMAKLMSDGMKTPPAAGVKEKVEAASGNAVVAETKQEVVPAPRFRIKIKNKVLSRPGS